MKNQIRIPRIDYIAFEILKVDLEKYLSQESYRAEQEDVIYLAVFPEQASYRLIGRNSRRQTMSKTFLQKFGLQPEQCRLSGTFGEEPRIVAGTFLNGWTRLKMFEEQVVRLVQNVDDENIIYILNYYDFYHQRFGSIDIDDFMISGNARENTMLTRYNCSFCILGPLIESNGQDILLYNLRSIFGEGGIIGNVTDQVNSLLEEVQFVFDYVGLGLATLKGAKSLVDGAVNTVNSYTNAGTKVYQNVTSLF